MNKDVPENAVFTDTVNPDIISEPADIITLGGLQGGIPFSEISVGCKNLFDGELVVGMVGVKSGMIDNTTNSAKRYLSTKKLMPAESMTTYTASNAESKKLDAVVYYNTKGEVIGNTYAGVGGFDTFTTPHNCKFIRWRYLFDDVQSDTSALTDVQIEKGNTATDYEDTLVGTSVGIRVCGKNLIPLIYQSATISGVDFAVNPDGSISVSGTATADIYYTLDARDYMLYKKGTVMSLSGCPKGGGLDTFNLYYSLRNVNNVSVGGHGDYGDGVTFTMSTRSDVTAIGVTIKISKNASVNATFYPQLEVGDRITPYEPYCGNEYCFMVSSVPCLLPEKIPQKSGINNLLISSGYIRAVAVREDRSIGSMWSGIKDACTDVFSDIGDVVTLDCIQGGIPFGKIELNCRNLLGQAVAKGVAGNTDSGFNLQDSAYARSYICKLLPHTTYTLKKYDKGNRFRFVFFDDEPSAAVDKNEIQPAVTSPTYTFTTGSDHLWMVYTSHYGDADSGVIEPVAQLEYGSLPTGYTPSIIGSKVIIHSCGKNLGRMDNKTVTVAGTTYTVSGETLTLNGEHTPNGANVNVDLSSGGYEWFGLTDVEKLARSGNFFIAPPGTYTLTVEGLSGNVVRTDEAGWVSIVVYNSNAERFNVELPQGGKKASITFTSQYPLVMVAQYITYTITSVLFDNYVCRYQLERGDTATEYEAYDGSVFEVTPDELPFTVTEDIVQQAGTNVVSVSAGEVRVIGSRINHTVKKIWDKLNNIAARLDDNAEVTTNGE